MGYQFNSRIRYSECDRYQKLTLDHLADYFQDCTVFHDEDVGFSMQYWIDKGAMWVTTSWKILIFRLPKCYEEVTVRTDAIKARGFKGERNFTLRDKDGHLLAAAYSKFALVDIKTGRPTRVDPEEGRRYGENDPLPIEEEKGHIILPEEAEKKDPIEIASYHLDSNQHVNNAQYIKMMVDLLPAGFDVQMMRVAYHRSAVLGDVLYPRLYQDGHTMLAAFENAEGEPYVLFQFADCLSETDRAVGNL